MQFITDIVSTDTRGFHRVGCAQERRNNNIELNQSVVDVWRKN
jgi:hypothetical protein